MVPKDDCRRRGCPMESDTTWVGFYIYKLALSFFRLSIISVLKSPPYSSVGGWILFSGRQCRSVYICSTEAHDRLCTRLTRSADYHIHSFSPGLPTSKPLKAITSPRSHVFFFLNSHWVQDSDLLSLI